MWEAPKGCSQVEKSSINTLFRELKEEATINVSEDNFRLIGIIFIKNSLWIFTQKNLNIY